MPAAPNGERIRVNAVIDGKRPRASRIARKIANANASAGAAAGVAGPQPSNAYVRNAQRIIPHLR